MNTRTGKKKKPVPCRFWMQGSCKYGDDCEYMHSMTPPSIESTSAPKKNVSDSKPSKAPVVVLDNSISPLLFGYGVVSFNTNHDLLFGSILPEDFFEPKETDFIKYLSRDLQILLKMPFNHFMSHIIYDDNLKRTLSSFFQYSPRVYDDNRATFASAPLYLLIFRIYYRLVTDTEGHKDFAKTSPPYGGLGKDIYDVLIKEHLISVEIVADWCSLLGLKNKDIIQQMVETLQLKASGFNDSIIGFFVDVREKMEECCQLLIDEETIAKKEDYLLFMKDILYTISLFVQCLPTSVYSMFDSVQSLLIHSEMKHVISSAFDICKDTESIKNLILKCYDLLCEKMIYCYADPTLSATIPSYHDDSLQTTFFDYLRSHINDTDSLDGCYIHEYGRDRLSRMPGWDEVQRAYFMEVLSDSKDSDFDNALKKLTIKRERAKVEKKEVSNQQFAIDLLTEMFPNFGKAYIAAVCQYYNLQKGGPNAEAELQRVVATILNNQLPRELLNMNQSANTVRELYNVVSGNSDEEKRRILTSLFSSKELKRMERMDKLSMNDNNEDNSALDEKTKKSILAQYNRGLYEDEGVDDDYVDAVHNVNRELESDEEEGEKKEDQEGMEMTSELEVISKKQDSLSKSQGSKKQESKKQESKKQESKKQESKESHSNKQDSKKSNSKESHSKQDSKKTDSEETPSKKQESKDQKKDSKKEGDHKPTESGKNSQQTDFRKNIERNKRNQQKRRHLAEKKRGLGM